MNRRDTGGTLRLQRRIRTMDAARGLTMLFVCFSHFGSAYLVRNSSHPLSLLPVQIGLIASPTFALMSGTMLGTLFVIQQHRFTDVREKLFDRALFLLLVAHALIACSRLAYETHPVAALRMTFMTDAIAVAIVVGLLLIDRVAPATRVLIGTTLVAFSWVLALFWEPHAGGGELAKELLVGANPMHVLAYSVPFLPWLGVYLAFTAFGQRIGTLYQQRDAARVERTFLVAGLAGVGGAALLRVVGFALRVPRLSTHSAAFVRSLAPTFSPTMKLPPGPTYLLFFGGLGLLLIWGVAVIDHHGYAEPVMAWAAMLGRCSLAVFIIQFYIFYTVVGAARLRYTHAWPLLFAASVGAISLFAAWWDGRNLNTALTVGLPQLRALLRPRAHAGRAA